MNSALGCFLDGRWIPAVSVDSRGVICKTYGHAAGKVSVAIGHEGRRILLMAGKSHFTFGGENV